jgi:uncharacterized membrane protein YdjX (TVP38/TMEM64 family)
VPESDAGKSTLGKNAYWLKPLGLFAVIAIIFILARAFGLGEKLGLLRSWIASLGNLAPLAYIVLYILATVAAIPGVALSVIAAALFGSFYGVVLVSVGSTIGAALAFLVSRYLARDAVSLWLKNNPRFLKLDALTEKHGAIMVAFTRLIPLFPFNVLNYGFGLTRVRFLTYVLFSWLFMLPGTVLYVVGFDAVLKGIADGKIPWLLILIFIVAAIVLFFLVRLAKNHLNRQGKVDATEETNKHP